MKKKFGISKTAFKTAAKTTAISILSMFVIMSISSCQGANTKDINTMMKNISIKDLENSGLKLIAREGKGALLEKDGQRIIVLKGTPYEMGYQHGVLLKDEVA
ncbi:MAG TPA: hypothetical protein GX527_02790, partial [Clostridiaceae bacterium]|nr:hypothetical protein [Clostridiaceae bacterium]